MLPICLIAAVAATPGWVNALSHLGLLGVGVLSLIDASFVPLPVPGAADLFLALMAAQSRSWLLLTGIATVGSLLGGAGCYYVGKLSGIHMLERRIPPRYFALLTRWVEDHAYAAVAIPAVLPPPFPLIPFVLAAGALKMPQKKFYLSFIVSRFIRHAGFALLGIHFSQQLKRLWPLMESRYALTALILFWIIVVILTTYSIVRLVRNQRAGKNASRHATA